MSTNFKQRHYSKASIVKSYVVYATNNLKKTLHIVEYLILNKKPNNSVS